MIRSLAVMLGSIAFGAVAAALPAHGQQPCPERQTVVDYLMQEFDEAPVAMGLANSGGLIEVLTNGQGNTWTILITTPDGRSCMIAAGQGWQETPATVPIIAEPGA